MVGVKFMDGQWGTKGLQTSCSVRDVLIPRRRLYLHYSEVSGLVWYTPVLPVWESPTSTRTDLRHWVLKKDLHCERHFPLLKTENSYLQWQKVVFLFTKLEGEGDIVSSVSCLWTRCISFRWGLLWLSMLWEIPVFRCNLRSDDVSSWHRSGCHY